MLIETDAPYLAPVPHRGRRNQPAYVAARRGGHRALRGVPVATIAAATSANFFRLFDIPEEPARDAVLPPVN